MATALLATTCGGVAAAAQPPDVVVITVDTLRPDALGWVAGRNPTPAIDALARESFRFPNAVSPVPLTLPAHTTLFTGLLPRRHGVRDNGQVASATPSVLAQVLRERGYETAAFVSGYPLRAPFGLSRGFDTYDDAIPAKGGNWAKRPAADTTAAALAWLGQRKRPSRPFFLFVHYYDAHDPYEPPAPLLGSGPRAAYDGEVRVVDEAVASLRSGLGARRATLTVLCGDHGESLGEHGEETHGFFVYDSTVLTPLVFHMPGRVRAGESRAPAGLVDVTPTVLDLLGLPALRPTDGVSLVPTLRGERQDVPPAYVESQQPWLGYGWAPLSAVRTATQKLILAPRVELYDLSDDPGETRDLAAARRDDVARLTRLAREVEGRPPVASATAVDAATAERLRSLGYVSGAAEAGASPPPGLADPKDRLPQKERLSRADAASLAGDYRTALALYDEALASEPDSRVALLRSASALVQLGRAPEAVTRAERLVRLDGRLAEARYVLADALTRAGDRRRAAEEWARTVELQPGRAVAWANLGAVLAQSGHWVRAEEAFEEAHRLAPEDKVVADNLGACRYELAVRDVAAGRLDVARKRLADAVLASPSLKAKAARDPRLKPLDDR